MNSRGVEMIFISETTHTSLFSGGNNKSEDYLYFAVKDTKAKKSLNYSINVK